MLHHARMTGLVKLQCGADTQGQCPVWAVCCRSPDSRDAAVRPVRPAIRPPRSIFEGRMSALRTLMPFDLYVAMTAASPKRILIEIAIRYPKTRYRGSFAPKPAFPK